MNDSVEQVLLHHIIVVGGSAGEWSATSDEEWSDRMERLGAVASAAGARWLVLRPYDVIGAAATALPERRAVVGGCEVLADAEVDGRRRLVEAVRAIHGRGVPISEAALDDVLHAPGEVDPDLVVVLGPSSRLPASVVWELAYSELVFVDGPWDRFDAAELEAAITTFTARRRRFGGVDE